MASAGDEQHAADIQQMMAAQIEQLLAGLAGTRQIATAQGCGVTVVWSRTAVPEMKVDMYVDTEVAVGDVRYRNAELPQGDSDIQHPRAV